MARSKEIAPGVGRLSRSKVASRRGLHKGLKKSDKPATAKTDAHKEAQVGGDKNGSKRLVPTFKAPRFYPAEDVRLPKKSRKSPKPAKLRSSITPGTVLILLAGRYRGKRVVFLKQLESGLLLVTGPFKVNGVPLRRVNQAYVIATSTKVELNGVQVRRCCNIFEMHLTQSHGRSTRRSTTLTSQKLRPKVLARRKKSSFRRASPKRRSLSPKPSRPTRRRSTKPSSLRLKKQKP